MEKKMVSIFFALVRSAITGKPLTDQERQNDSPDRYLKLLKWAAKYDLAHLIALALRDYGLVTNRDAEAIIFKTAYRYEQMQHELDRICTILEKAEIPFIPLKGSVIHKYYPEPWMRTSCDIDILIHEKDIDRAVKLFLEDYGFTYYMRGTHDVSLLTPSRVNVELHFDLVEDWVDRRASKVLKGVWDTAVVRTGYQNWFEMTDAMFYYYHIAHLAKHFENGGCGIRPLIDLWLLDRMPEGDQKERDRLLRKGNFLTFANVVRKVSRVWMEDEPHDSISQKMEEYILRGGAYGDKDNGVVAQQRKYGGQLGFILSKVFLRYEIIKIRYPVLEKHRWLTPIMEVRRWFEIVLFRKRRRNASQILKRNTGVSDAQIAEMCQFLNEIGL